jgi:glycosyltransferase involved in cell wall biosynthesis
MKPDHATIPSIPCRVSAASPLSVIVPVYNGANDLQRCLDALAASDHDDFEVIVVDDGSTTPLEPLVTKHGFT